MAADSSVIIKCKLDDKQPQAELNRLVKKIDSLDRTRAKANERRLQWADEADKRTLKLEEAQAKLLQMQAAPIDTYSAEQFAEQKELIKGRTAFWADAQKRADAYNRTVEKSTLDLEDAEERAGQLAAQLSASANAAEEGGKKISLLGTMGQNAGNKAASGLKKLEKRIVGLAKRVFVFSVITQLLRKVRAAIGDAIGQNEEAAAAIANLKTAFSNLAAPIIQAVLPALTTFLNMLTYIINAISSLFGGTSATTGALDKEKKALKETGAAAGKASKQLANFDEINRLAEESGGGGGAADKSYTFDPSVLPDKFTAAIDSFVMSFKDIFFDWGANATPEDIVQKAITALGAFIGVGLGFMFGGVPGAITGALIGTLASVVFSSLVFDHDGTISRAELTKLIMAGIGGLIGAAIGITLTRSVAGGLIGFAVGASISLVFSSLTVDKNGQINGNTAKSVIIGGITGIFTGILGFALGGVPGALIGFTIGAGLSLVISAIQRKKTEDAYLSTAFGQQMQELVNEAAAQSQASVDLLVNVRSITGEVDSSTMANFSLAKQLIDDIFTMDSADNKTAAEIAVIEEKIQTLNGLGLEGLNLSFDESTGHVSQTKDEVDKLMDSILKQYKIEAMREAYIQQYKNQYDAVTNLESSTEAYKNAMNELAEAEDYYNTLLVAKNEAEKEWREAVERDDIAVQDYNKRYGEANDALKLAEMRYNDAKTAVNDLKTALENSQTAVEETTRKMAELQVALDGLVTGSTENGKAVIDGMAAEIAANTPRLEDAMKAATAALDGTFRTQTKITGAESGLYREEARFITDGITAGLADGEGNLITEMIKMTNLMKDTFEEQNDINSPSGVYETEGDMLMEGLANGITNNAFKPLNAMRALMNDLITLAERGMNNIVTKFNGIATAVSALGGGTVPTLDRAYIPRLAQGAVIPPNREFLAVLGDQKHGTNIETPLSTMVEAFRQAMGGSTGTRQPIVLEVGGREFGRIIVDLYNQESQRVGIKIGGKA